MGAINPGSGGPTDNTTGGVPVGDNAGAFATGFSTGPDARSVTFDKTNGSVVIQMDQRVDPSSVNPIADGEFRLLANDGTTISGTPLSAAVVNNAPFQSQIRLTYNPSDVGQATSLLIEGPPTTTNPSCSTVCAPAAYTFGGNGYDAQGTVRQVISPTASAAAFHDPAAGQAKVTTVRFSKASIRRAVASANHHHATLRAKARAKRHAKASHHHH